MLSTPNRRHPSQLMTSIRLLMQLTIIYLVGFCSSAQSPVARADDVVLKDGRRIPGFIVSANDRQVVLRSPAGAVVPPLPSVDHIELARQSAAPLRVASPFRFSLRDGQVLTGGLHGLGDMELAFETAWARDLVMPRRQLGSIVQPPGLITLAANDFADAQEGWTRKGFLPESNSADSGKRGLLLDRIGQQAVFVLPKPLAEGRVGLNVELLEPTQGAQWFFDAELETKPGARSVRIVFAGDKQIKISSGLSFSYREITAKASRFRLQLELRDSRCSVSIDDAVIGLLEAADPQLALKRVRIGVDGPNRERYQGSVLLSQFGIARNIGPLRRPPSEPRHDELWLTSGDQLFGELLRAEARSVQFRNALGSSSFAWSELRGLYLRQDQRVVPSSTGVFIAIGVRSGLDNLIDRLHGRVLELDDQRLVFQHESLGRLHIPRSQLESLRFLDRGSP